MQPNPEVNPSSPTDILRQELSQLKEINTSLVTLQESQIKLQQGIANLVKINAASANDGMKVFIENVNMPFFSMVGLMIKWSIASIPAAIILTILAGLVFAGISLACGGLTGILTVLSRLGK